MGMNPRTFDRWVKALESGKYPKGKSFLLNRQGGYCCLGVLERVCGVPADSPVLYQGYAKGDEEESALPHRGLSSRVQIKLGDINDASESFAPVIAYLKRNRARLVAK